MYSKENIKLSDIIKKDPNTILIVNNTSKLSDLVILLGTLGHIAHTIVNCKLFYVLRLKNISYMCFLVKAILAVLQTQQLYQMLF